MIQMSMPKKLAVYAMTVVSAVAIGFGVPLAWVWIGSQLQGGDGASSTSFSVAVAILFGIIATYVLMGFVAGWIQSRFEDPELAGRNAPRRTSQMPWMQSQSDTQGRAGSETRLRPLEFVFVTTTLVVSGAFWIWFLFFAQGGGLPNP